MSGVLLLGGTSEIGLAIVARLLDEGAARATLAGRDEPRLGVAAAKLAGPGRELHTLALDLAPAGHGELIERAARELGGLEVVVLAVGALEGEPADVLAVNALGAGSLLLAAAEHLRAQGAGTLVVLSSAAALRARRSNPAYGASKAALDQLALATADRLHGSGARVLVVRPGFVRTRMTAHLPDAPLATTADAVAAAVSAGLRRGGRVVWVPRAMAPIMTVLRLLPAPLFRMLPW